MNAPLLEGHCSFEPDCGRTPAASTVKAIDLRYLELWAKTRKRAASRQRGMDEVHPGKKQKFLTVVSNLETGEPLWFGRERKEETLVEVRHDRGRKAAKAYRISSGNRRVHTTFASELETFGAVETEWPQKAFLLGGGQDEVGAVQGR